jgi:hypothetical protein
LTKGAHTTIYSVGLRAELLDVTVLALDNAQKDLQRESQRSDLLGNSGGKRHPGQSDSPYSDEPGYDRDQRGRLLAGTETLNDGELGTRTLVHVYGDGV